jgi:alpha-L-fucosidase 2
MKMLCQYFHHVPSEYRTVGGDWVVGVYSNLFSSCPPMQIDGSFGMCAAIAEMLVGERDGEPCPLPALPKEIKSGSYKITRVK